MKRVSVPSASASTRAMMRSTRLQLAGGAVVELPITAHLARLRGGDEARQRAGFQALDIPAQGRGRRNAEDEVDPVGATPVDDLRAAIVAVGAQQEVVPHGVV